MKENGRARDNNESPARHSEAITPHDTNAPASFLPRAIYVGGDGDLVVRLQGDDTDTTFVGVLAGSILPIRPKLVKAATTATNLLALY